MRIVVLDGYTLNPGDLSWSALESFGTVVVHDRTPQERILERADGAEIVLTNKCPLRAETIAQLDALRYIGVLASGVNVVDTSAARARGIPVVNVPDYGTPSVAQHVFALLLELTNSVAQHSDSVRQGEWAKSVDFCYWKKPLIELAGLNFGLVGYGRIGRATAAIAQAFGMRVSVHSRTSPESVALEKVFSQSDVVSLHCPLTDQTKHLVNAERLAMMKPSSYLINTGRGPLIDETALADALNTGRLAGAGLDVLSVEPPSANNPLFTAKNCVITPHIAWASQAARRRLMEIAVGNVQAFLAGQPRNVVN